MPTSRPDAAPTRLLVVVALAVAALLLAPVAGVSGAVAGGQARPAAPAQGQAATTTQGAHVDAVSAQRKAKNAKKVKNAKKGKKARKRVIASTRVETGATSASSIAWTTRTLTYYDGLPSEWDWSLDTAVAQWNATGAGPTLVEVSSPGSAQLRVSYGDIGGNSGLATVGRASGAFVKLSDRYGKAIGDEYDRVEVLGVLTHELGHVLGLSHVTTSCALMGPVMDIVGCGIFDQADPTVYRCDVIGADALASAARLYGRTPSERPTGSCPVGPAAA